MFVCKRVCVCVCASVYPHMLVHDCNGLSLPSSLCCCTHSRATSLATPPAVGVVVAVAAVAAAAVAVAVRPPCSICLLMSTVVMGTHVCHVGRRAGSTFTWCPDQRAPSQPRQPSQQMFGHVRGPAHRGHAWSEGLEI